MSNRVEWRDCGPEREEPVAQMRRRATSLFKIVRLAWVLTHLTAISFAVCVFFWTVFPCGILTLGGAFPEICTPTMHTLVDSFFKTGLGFALVITVVGLSAIALEAMAARAEHKA